MEDVDLTGIETRKSLKGVTSYRGYVKVDGRKAVGGWTTDYLQAKQWRELALVVRPVLPPRKRRRGEKRPYPGSGHIYYVRAGEDGPVKIGWSSTDPARRMVTLQSGNHIVLQLLGSEPGTERGEMLMHSLLEQYRIRGEWFDLPADVLTQILEAPTVALGSSWDPKPIRATESCC